MIDGVQLVPLRVIPTPGGEVRHALKANAPGFAGFGEAYFSELRPGAIKAWKLHRHMVCNLVGAAGEVRVQLLDLRPGSATHGADQSCLLGPLHAQRLVLPPGLWFGLQGRGVGLNLVLNIASIAHDPAEAESAALDDPRFCGLPW